MSFIDSIRQIIGSPPDDYAVLEYVVAAVLLVFVLHSCFKLINSLFHIGR